MYSEFHRQMHNDSHKSHSGRGIHRQFYPRWSEIREIESASQVVTPTNIPKSLNISNGLLPKESKKFHLEIDSILG